MTTTATPYSNVTLPVVGPWPPLVFNIDDATGKVTEPMTTIVAYQRDVGLSRWCCMTAKMFLCTSHVAASYDITSRFFVMPLALIAECQLSNLSQVMLLPSKVVLVGSECPSSLRVLIWEGFSPCPSLC